MKKKKLTLGERIKNQTLGLVATIAVACITDHSGSSLPLPSQFIVDIDENENPYERPPVYHGQVDGQDNDIGEPGFVVSRVVDSDSVVDPTLMDPRIVKIVPPLPSGLGDDVEDYRIPYACLLPHEVPGDNKVFERKPVHFTLDASLADTAGEIAARRGSVHYLAAQSILAGGEQDHSLGGYPPFNPYGGLAREGGELALSLRIAALRADLDIMGLDLALSMSSQARQHELLEQVSAYEQALKDGPRAFPDGNDIEGPNDPPVYYVRRDGNDFEGSSGPFDFNL